MKILIINVVCGIKSTGRICADIAETLEKQGHEVKIAYGRGTVPIQYQKNAVRIGTIIDTVWHLLKARFFDGCGFGSKRATRRFVTWIQEYNPDVIHLHNLHGYYINVEYLFNYLRNSNKRIIWTLHDCWAFSGHSALCDGDNCKKWEKGCSSCPQKNVYPSTMIDRCKQNWEKKRLLFTGVSNLTIVTPSKWLSEEVKKSFLKYYPVKVIENGIDTRFFRPVKGGKFRERYCIEDKYIILGVAGVWKERKGFEDFLELSTYLDSRCKIILVGVEKQLRTDAYSNLLTLGPTSGVEELVDIYNSANVFVNLTYCDTFPTVNLEARACGLPIITYNTGGSPEAAGEEAIVVEKGDLKAVYQSIMSLINDGSDISKKCHFSVDKNDSIRKYINVITGNESNECC